MWLIQHAKENSLQKGNLHGFDARGLENTAAFICQRLLCFCQSCIFQSLVGTKEKEHLYEDQQHGHIDKGLSPSASARRFLNFLRTKPWVWICIVFPKSQRTGNCPPHTHTCRFMSTHEKWFSPGMGGWQIPPQALCKKMATMVQKHLRFQWKPAFLHEGKELESPVRM